MSDYEFHKGKLKKVDLSKFENSREKYFESRYRYEFEKSETNPNGLTDDEIQLEYQNSFEDKYRDNGPWEHLWYTVTDLYDSVIDVKGELWEVSDIELEDSEDVFFKISDNEYEYYTSFYNGGCCLSEVLEDGLTREFKKNNK